MSHTPDNSQEPRENDYIVWNPKDYPPVEDISNESGINDQAVVKPKKIDKVNQINYRNLFDSNQLYTLKMIDKILTEQANLNPSSDRIRMYKLTIDLFESYNERGTLYRLKENK